jgi:glycyl-tRNA synthetase beta chain
VQSDTWESTRTHQIPDRDGDERSGLVAEDFLLEIGVEEIPAAFLPKAIEHLQAMGEELFALHRLRCEGVEAMATPRRLTLLVRGMEEQQGDAVQEISGPPRSVAYDGEGNPTQVLEKFCARHGVEPRETSMVTREKGEYVFVSKVEAGRTALEVLPEILPSWIVDIPFPKSMRWGTQDIRFARPIRWIVALYGRETVPFRVGDLESGSTTRGHRFLGDSNPIRIEPLADYREILARHKVLVDPEERRRRILDQARGLAAEVNGEILEEEGLIQTLVFITEYPVAVRGTFREKFLALPEEVLIAPMKGHQKYFPVKRRDGKGLLPYFVTVANMEAPDMQPVQRGNEKVLAARLEDAKFFFEEDTKKPLEQYVDSLQQVIYHKKLGTSYEKVARIEALARFLGERLCPDRQEVLQRAARLCKADLVTQMVGEFPELQGTMGGIYAAASGESEEVSAAIREHYMPVSAEGDLPQTLGGAVISLADKMDTVVGFFSTGSPVSGTSDPFGMRRRAIGILRVLLDMELHVSLPDFVDKASELLAGRVKKNTQRVKEEVLGFFRLRYQQILLAREFPHDTIEAVLSASFESIPDLFRRVAVLHRMRSEPDFEKLILGCKRAVNILQQAEKDFGYDGGPGEPLKSEDLEEDAEKALLASTEEVGKALEGLDSNEYDLLLQRLVGLKEPIDRLFDDVMILVEDDRTRENRLKLLHKVSDLFQWFADFSKISL